MTEIIQKVKNLSIGFKSKKGEEILILRNISTNIKKGETVKFVVKNMGELVHEFNIATKEMHIKHQPEMLKMVAMEILLGDRIDKKKMKEAAKSDHSMAHSHSNSVLLEPKKIGELVWKFSKDTKLEAACNVPGHYQAGMVAKVNIN